MAENQMNDMPAKADLFSELQGSFVRLQCALEQQSDESTECNTNDCFRIVTEQIRSIDQFEHSPETFDIVEMGLRIYISDILPLTDKYEEILSSLSSANINFNLNSLFKQDENFTRRVFFSSFYLLSLPIMVDYLEGKQQEAQTKQLQFTMNIVINRLLQVSEWMKFANDDLNQQESILRLLLKFVNSSIQEENSLIEQIFKFLVFLTEQTILVPSFINAGFVTYILQWLEIEQLTYEIQGSCIHIFYNLAQKCDGAKALNQADGLRVLKDCTYRLLDPSISHGQYGFENLQLLYCMAMSLLIEPQQNREYVKSHRRILDYLLQATINASMTDDLSYAGFHISRPIVVLTKLFVQDEIIKYVLDEAPVKNLPLTSKVTFFISLLVQFRDAFANDEDETKILTLTALFNILWSISFHDEYRPELQNDRQFLLTVKTFANDLTQTANEKHVFSHMSPIFKAASGILLNLSENTTVRATDSSTSVLNRSTTSIPGQNNRTNVMISYSHANADFCRTLVDALQKDPRLDIWVDFIYCRSGDLWEEISEAIENAHVILFLITKEYQSSKSCRQEVMYARDTLKKRFVPIYLKNDYVASSWLGIRIVGAQYIRFQKRSFGDTITEILNLVVDYPTQKQRQNVLKKTKLSSTLRSETIDAPYKISVQNPEKHQGQVVEEHLSPISEETSPIKQWTTENIDQWFDQSSIEPKLKDLYRFQHGIDLLLYGKCLEPDWQQEYTDVRERYAREYGETLYRDQFVRFVGALHRLLSK